MKEFTLTQAKALIKEIGRFEIESYDSYGLTVLSSNSGEYLIGTDEECDDAWNENLDDYIDECILPTLDKNFEKYFDNESWKRDARYDGRGHSLSTYDGEEIKVADLFLFRTN